LDKDAFLQLLIQQLKYQDPLNPMDGTQYSAQLAQFSSLEQLQNINNSLNNSIDANYLLAQSVNNSMSATLIGKDAKINTDKISNEGQESVTIGYDLPATGKNVKVTIKNEAGSTVKTFTDLDSAQGDYKLDWDFTDDSGKKVSTGDYKVEVSAETTGGEEMTATQYLIGTIGGVRFGSSGTSILVNGLEYSISDIFEILQNE
jgi:flagellar basal-body rod modification protein FlgD